MSRSYHSNGKLLISGEYLVLDGAQALSIPTKFGQKLKVEPSQEPGIQWSSIDHQGNVWYKESFQIISGKIKSINPDGTNQLVRSLIQLAYEANPNFLSEYPGFKCISSLEFPQDWGLGSSSTLIHNIALWAEVDPFHLSDNTLGGSGYDIAAAGYDTPLLYRNSPNGREHSAVSLPWNFTDRIFFIHLNQKQNSRAGIRHYNALNKPNEKQKLISEISEITEALVVTESLSDFESLLNKHETKLSELLEIPTIKSELFPDFPGLIKSLGAWGGDFIMVSGDASEMDYFRQKQFHTIIPFDEMIA